MAQESLITDEVRAVIGVEVVEPPELIEMKAIRDYATAIAWPDPPDPLHVDEEYAKKTRYDGIIAPWSFYTSIGIGFLQPQQRLSLPPFRGGVNGGNDYQYFLPIRPGDVITITSKIANVSEREGRMGKLVIVELQRTFTNQRGDVVGISQERLIEQY